MLLIIVNSSSLNVALPTLVRDLGASSSDLQWIVAAYSLVFAGLLFTCGTLGDRFGRRGAMQIGLVVFAAASGAAALATEPSQVIACRGAMGLGAALIMPSTLSIIMGTFPPHERPTAIAAWAGVTGVAGSIGPLFSGYLLEHNGYEAVFLMNVPIAVVAFIGSTLVLPRSRDPRGTALDPVGAALSVVTLTTLVWSLISAPRLGWTSPASLATFAGALVAGVVFVRWEQRRRDPMLDIGLFADRSFSTGALGMSVGFLALFGVSYLLSQYFQLVLGLSPFETALKFLPTGLTLVAVSAITPRASRRFGVHRVAGTGMGLIAISMALVTTLRPTSPLLYVLGSMVVLMAGLALTLSPLTAAVMSAVPASRPGAGSATNNSTRELGGALGVAVLGSIASSHYVHHLHDIAAALPDDLRRSASTSLTGALSAASQLPGDAGDHLATEAKEAFVGGLRLAAVVPLALSVVAAIVIWRRLPASPTGVGNSSGVEAIEVATELQHGAPIPTTAPARTSSRSTGPLSADADPVPAPTIPEERR